ncbi:hypothetical protein ILYODFUR_029713 [Ilyodon furcidens]|uniref:Uncharacterized protein n=1 Tax=Ilyodon furcidens TaxID=33524 RepID=A0ABV0T2S0_9TELE
MEIKFFNQLSKPYQDGADDGRLGASLSFFVYFVCFYVFRATILWSHSVERNFSISESPLLGFFHHLSSIRGSLSSWRAELRLYTGSCAESVEGETVLARW